VDQSRSVFDAPSAQGRAEFSLTALAYNLRRVLNIVEFPTLMAALRA
jgi:hypothetical protein